MRQPIAADHGRIPLEEPAKPIRVLIIDLPGVLSEIVRETVGREDDMIVAGEVTGDVALDRAIDEARADVVILQAGHPTLADSASVSVLDGKAPALRLLAVSDDGRESFLYALKPVRIPLGELSPSRLVTAIRSDIAASTRPQTD